MALNIITSLFVLVSVPLQPAQPTASTQSSQPKQLWPEELQGISINWINSNWHSAYKEAKLLIYSYDLKPDVLPAFWHEFYSNWAEEYHYEMAYFRQNNEGKSEKVLLQELQDFTDRMPIRPERLSLLVESLLEPRDFSVERRRYEELRFRRDQRTWVNEDQRIRRDTFIRQAKRSRLLRISRLTDHGHPMPFWVYSRRKMDEELRQEKELDEGEHKKQTIRRKSSWTPGGSAVRRQDGQRDGTPGLMSPADKPRRGKKSRSPLPALSPRGRQRAPAAASAADSSAYQDVQARWSGYLHVFSKKHLLNDKQRQQAKHILSEMLHRARSYLQSRQTEYDKLEALTNRKEYADRRSQLDVPLQNLFEEFKLRLEAIAGDRFPSSDG